MRFKTAQCKAEIADNTQGARRSGQLPRFPTPQWTILDSEHPFMNKSEVPLTFG